MSEALKLAEAIEAAGNFPAYPKAPYVKAAEMLRTQAAEIASLRAERDALKAELECIELGGSGKNFPLGMRWITVKTFERLYPKLPIDAAKEQKQ